MSETKTREKTKTLLKVMPIPEVYFSEYQYFVDTPEGDTLYFSDKKKANSFIEFYKQYPNKKITRKNCNMP